jgi:L-ascorbate metabolism protein UlaG (beta-lactamase superfamily)
MMGASGAKARGTATLTVRRVVHASVLIDFDGETILTDPWFSELSGHRWGEALGVALEELPTLSGVVASHADYDHFDMGAFSAYPNKDVPFVLRRGTADTARAAGFRNVTEIEPWEPTEIGSVRITAAPAKHKELLGIMQNTYVLEGAGFTVYFGGDTLLIPELGEVARRFPKIDLALLPINGLKLRPLMNRQMVMNAEQAAELTAILEPRVVVPIHYRYAATFPRTLLIEHERDPGAFVRSVEHKAPGTEARVLTPGEPLELGRKRSR